MHVVSQATSKDLIKVNRKARVNVVYNGVDIQNDALRTGNCRYEKFLLYIGRLVSTKNLGVAILAFKQLTVSIPDAKLVIVGAGPMRCEWERLVSSRRLDKNIIFLGHVSEDVKHDLLCSCCALILPSKLEGFGRVIIEAFAYSKPVLVSNLHSIKEIVDDGLNGFLVSPYDIDAWAEKMRDLLCNLDKCRTMGNNGRKKVERKFNLELVSDEIEDLYKRIVSEFSSN